MEVINSHINTGHHYLVNVTKKVTPVRHNTIGGAE